MEEHELVRRAREGDRQAFALLVQKYQSKVHSLIYGFTRDAALADDLAQDVFLKSWFGLSRFKGLSGFGTWLYRITVNHVKDHFRKASSSKELPLNQDLQDRAMKEDNSPAGGETEEAERRLGVVRQCLAGLPEKHRVILTLRDVQGLSYEEISRVLGLSAGTVDSRLFRARRLLREKVNSRMDDTRRSP